MQREIKFRAWSYWRCNKKHVMLYSDDITKAGSYNGNNFNFEIDGEFIINVMQYTGLKDKNDKEIYEGDILKAINAYGDDWFVFISFDRGMFLGKVNQSHKGMALYQWDLIHYEIIGNIHDNPELLGAN